MPPKMAAATVVTFLPMDKYAEAREMAAKVVPSPAPAGQDEKRDKWASKWEYLLSLAGVAIGLGNVWRFPYICYRNGGGAFLIPYFLMLAVVGLPIFLLESSLGQFSSSGCIAIYEACPAFKGIGFTSLLVTLTASTYYSVVIAYPLLFIPFSFWKEVPWATCGNSWNTPACATNQDQFLMMAGNDTVGLLRSYLATSPADEFFHNKILHMSSGITEPVGLVPNVVLATLFVWLFVFFCIFKGVKIVGKIVWFTSTFPFVMLFALLVRGLTLPGASEGIKYFIYPDFSRIMHLEVWVDAASQIFFSLQVGWGSLITMGSYNDYRNNSLKDALWIPILNCATSILAGFVVFSVLGFMAFSKGVTVDEVVEAGPSLAFITYPEALAMMPMPQMWAIFFFLMLFFLGIDSCFVQIQTMVASLSDEFPGLRGKKSLVSFVLCFIMFIGSLACCTEGGIYVLTLLDHYSVVIPISVACLLEVVVFSYIYGGGALVQDLQLMTRKSLNQFWWFCWMYLTPFATCLVVGSNIIDSGYLRITYKDYVFPSWTKTFGWLLALSPVLAIPALWIGALLFRQRGTFLQRLREIHRPSAKWGPKQSEDRAEWDDCCSRTTLRERLVYKALDQ